MIWEVYTAVPGVIQWAFSLIATLMVLISVYLVFDFVAAINHLITAKAKLLEAQAKWLPYKNANEPDA